MENNSKLKRVLSNKEAVLGLILIIYCLFVGLMNPSFFSVDVIFDILKSGTGMTILAMGCLVVMISGGIDVSFTAIAISAGYLSIKLLISLGLNNIFIGFLIAALIGIFLGLINGLIIHYFKLPTLIATLATQNIFWGLLTIIGGTKFIGAGKLPKCILSFSSSRLITITTSEGQTGLSLFIIPLIIFSVLTWFILNKTVKGRSIYAMGSSNESASRAGISLFNTRLFVYTFSGALAGCMGIIYAAETRSINPISLVGEELNVIAAVVLGGARLSGGTGTVLGTLLGVYIITVLKNTLVLVGLSASWNSFFVGLIILASVAVTSYQQIKKNQEHLIFTN